MEEQDTRTYSLKIPVHALEFLAWLDQHLSYQQKVTAFMLIDGATEGFGYWGRHHLKPDGANLPVRLKINRDWQDYLAELECFETNSGLEITIKYAAAIESFVMKFIVTIDQEYRYRSQNSFEPSSSVIDVVPTIDKGDREDAPWKQIPDFNWDRIAIELWCQGHTNREIAQKINVTPKTVTNRISYLRKMYPNAGIPKNDDRRKFILDRDKK